MATVSVRMPIEVDVTYVNKTWFSPKKPSNIRQYVIGFYQRGGMAIITSIPNNDPETIKNTVCSRVEKGAMLYAQEGILPASLNELYEVHNFQPTDGRSVNGDIHINNVNNMWKDLKRQLKRTFIQVSSKHLQSYCDEVVWHINTRDLTPEQKFELLMSNCVRTEKRTYQDLIK